ncbi:MAG: ADP-ribosylglycohydrolase family protein [Desulfuromonadales bacterium]|nr:ADP-ribosylglycohydrolase family protein [Desulfuromonadales bacterium]
MNATQPTDNRPLSLADRVAGAVWGQFVGDAFCLGSHWIYDPQELQRRFPGGPQGFEEPGEGHYHFGKQPGDFTHYGDAALLLLRSLVERSHFDVADFGVRFVTMVASPGYKGYRDHAAKGTLANYLAFREAHCDGAYSFQDGADDDQPATVSRLAPLAARCFRSPDYLLQVERATRVCQNNDLAVEYVRGYALTLRELFAGISLQESLRSVAQQISADSPFAHAVDLAFSAVRLPVGEATMRFGQSCPLPSTVPSALQCALCHGDDFRAAMRANAAAGGDSAGRAAMVGTMIGAAYGIGVVPADWREALTACAEIAAGVDWLCGQLEG